jgi:3-dehydro-L-gulonate 2-dehydrogenase
MKRIPYDVMYQEFLRVLMKYNMTKERAELSAKLYADASLDGVYTHGLNRFPKFINSVNKGCVNINAVPVMTEHAGVLERWDGQKGPGNLNAYLCMNRAIELAHEGVIGCVALSNTNHWMRPGAYGLMAADQNCIAILWTNTVPNMPAWGGKDAKLGNNPLVIAIPHKGGHVLVDVAMSMFSYGKLESFARQDKPLPVDGGFDKDGNMTKDASKILSTHQTLPIGFWKGSGLSLTLDLIASVLANGRSSLKVGELPVETELSQVLIAIDLSRLSHGEETARSIEETLADLHSSIPMEAGGKVHYPGEGMLRVRAENQKNGIPVEESVWDTVLKL